MFCKKGVLKNFAKRTKNTCVGVPAFQAATFKRLRHRCFLVNFSIFLRNIFYTKHLQWLLLQRFSTKKYFKLSVNITIYMLHVLLSRASVCLCMWGFQKEKKWKKIIARSTKAAKKVEVFVQNIFFRQTVFSFTKKNHLFFRVYFSRCHWQYFRRISRFNCNSR